MPTRDGRWSRCCPGCAGCLVLVTSRRRLTGLRARHGAENLALDVLPPGQAAQLFATMSGRAGNDRDAAAIDDLVALCGYLPLAICLLAAKLRPEPHWRVGDLVRELTQSSWRLAQMSADDVAVAAAFSLSYRKLPAARRRLFRRLGLHPGTDLETYAAAALDGVTPGEARRHLNELYHEHLLDQPLLGRFRMHDLIREFARSQGERDPADDRARSFGRLVSYYTAGARAADRQLLPPADGLDDDAGPAADQHVDTVPCQPALPELPTRHAALAWLRAEQANLLGVAALADHHQLVALAAAMATYLRRTGPWEPALALHRAAAAAAHRLGDRAARATALRDLGVVQRLSGNYADAHEALGRSYEIFRDLGDRRGMADLRTCLAAAQRRAGDPRTAARHLAEALALFEALNDARGQAVALCELGVVRHMAGDHEGSVDALRRCLALHRELGDLRGQATALTQLGCAEQLTGQYQHAVNAYERALDLYQDLEDRHGRARALNYLGVVRSQIGEFAAAQGALTEALGLHRELGYRVGEANALLYLGIVQCRTGDTSSAERTLTLALALHRDLGNRMAEADVLDQFGVLRRLTGDYEAAAESHRRALAMYREVGDGLGEAEVHNNMGTLYLMWDEPCAAQGHFRRALRLARQAHNPREEATAIEGSGRCAVRLGEPRAAVSRLRRAAAGYQRIGAIHAARNVAKLIDDLTRP